MFGLGRGGQGGCERRIEVFVKIQKKGGGGVEREGVRWGGWSGFWMDNAMLGVGGDEGYGNQEKNVLYNVQQGIVQHKEN